MPTAKSGSVMSCTVDRSFVTSTTLPTSPAPLTTGMPTLIPSLLPLEMSTVWEKFDGLPESTRGAVVVSMSPTHSMLELLEQLVELLRRRPPPGPADPRASSICRRSSSFSAWRSP